MNEVDASQHLAQVLRSLDPGVPPRHADDAVVVDHVPGAFVVRGLMSATECGQLSAAVQRLTNEAMESYPQAALGRGTDPSAVTRRRNSQHHTPCQVAPEDLAVLAARLRPCLPAQAGPKNLSKLQLEGSEVSGFLRCYYYQTGDASAPHYDRSFRQHEGDVETHFSAYSLLLYLNDDFTGGHTTFLAAAGDGSKRSRNGATRVKVSRPLEDATALEGSRAAAAGGSETTAAATDKPASTPPTGTVVLNLDSSASAATATATAAPGLTSTPSSPNEEAEVGGDEEIVAKKENAIENGSQPKAVAKSNAAAPVSSGSSSGGGGDCVELAAQRNSLAHTHTKVTSVAPRIGDALIFPHGRTPGCFPDPLHEGSEVTYGAKALIRSDIIFTHPPPRNKRKKQKH